MDFITNKWVDGIILMTDCETDQNTRLFLEKKKTPIVYLGLQPENSFDHSGSTRVNGESIGFLGAEHLIQKGHKHIACIGMTDWIKKGIVNAEHSCAAPQPGLEIEYWSYDLNSHTPMKEILDRWLKTAQKPSALFFNGDNFACDFINLAVRAGVKIPADLALLGVNDLPEAAKAIYPLSTIRQPQYSQGEIACKLLFDMIEGKPSQRILLEPELVVRETT
jgi:LacI family transcriptional regulator